MGEEVIRISRIGLWKGIAAILGLLLVISIYTGGFGTGTKTAATGQIVKEATPPPQAVPEQQPPSVPATNMAALADDDPVKGDPNAPVTIVEWSDFECPFCQKFFMDTLPSITKEYIDKGKVKLVYRDFPLSFHQNAQKAAEAAECADEQGKFWEMHDLLFNKGVSGGVATFKQYAKDLGLDTTKFSDCLDSGKTASETAKDQRDGSAVGIQGTPGFIINGQLVSGAQPFANFKAVIDAELAKVDQ